MKRIAIPMLLLVLLIAGCGGAPAVAPAESPAETTPAEPAPPPDDPTPVQTPPADPLPPPEVDLLFAGDLMLERTPGEFIAKGEDPYAAFADLFQEAEIAVGNLECVIATVGEAVPKAYNFRCHPRNIPLLSRYFSAVSVANNHSGDYGKEAFAEQLALLKSAGLPFFGGGMDQAEAHTPLILERNGLKIAMLGYNEIELRSYEAGPTTPGLAWSIDEMVEADIRAARPLADIVVVYPHWGLEYHATPSERQQLLARKMIDAGADLVVGGHPHVTQGVEIYNGHLIAYSLGNFVFDDFKDVPPSLDEPSRTSWLLRVTLGKEGLIRWETIVARTDDRGFPQLVPGAESPCGSEADPTTVSTCTAP